MTITLNSAVGTSVSAGQLKNMRISFLYYSRFDIDSLEVVFPSNKADLANMELSFKALIEEGEVI
jgi:hypothetical protein